MKPNKIKVDPKKGAMPKRKKKTKKLKIVTRILREYSGVKPKPSPIKKQIPYSKFLKTKYWYRVRRLVMTRDNFICQKCGGTKNLRVHHLTYENHYKEHEHIEDLITLCKDCHDKEHKIT